MLIVLISFAVIFSFVVELAVDAGRDHWTSRET